MVVIEARLRGRPRDGWRHVAGVTVGQDLSERVVQTRPPAPSSALASRSPGLDHRSLGDHPRRARRPRRPRPRLLGQRRGGAEEPDLRPDLRRGRPGASPLVDHAVAAGRPHLHGHAVRRGRARTPPRFLAPGDELVSTIEGIGTIHTHLVEELTSWPLSWKSPTSECRSPIARVRRIPQEVVGLVPGDMTPAARPWRNDDRPPHHRRGRTSQRRRVRRSRSALRRRLRPCGRAGPRRRRTSHRRQSFIGRRPPRRGAGSRRHAVGRPVRAGARPGLGTGPVRLGPRARWLRDEGPGFGHVVFVVSRPRRGRSLRRDALGFTQSDWLETDLGGLPLTVRFYCNPRHLPRPGRGTDRAAPEAAPRDGRDGVAGQRRYGLRPGPGAQVCRSPTPSGSTTTTRCSASTS